MADDSKKYDSEKTELQKRFEALPENLKRELLADKNVQLVSRICQDYSIPEDQVKIVAMVVGEIFLGYMKPEEISPELHEHFQIDLQKANLIEIELKQKLFNALKADLQKVYNPLPAVALAEEGTIPEEEISPAVIKLEKEAVPLSTISSQPVPTIQKNYEQKIPAMGTGTAASQPQPVKLTQPAPAAVEMPFIIQTKIEAIKPTMPQFPKETPSLSLKIEPSLAPKPSAPKPISVRLETEQPDNVKFKMPVFPQSKIGASLKPSEAPVMSKTVEKQPTAQSIAPKVTPVSPIIPPKPAATTSEKPMSELKPETEEPRTVHYSNFKTPLTSLGTPKKPEGKKEDYINLSTFTKVSGNTVDLRKK